MNFAASFDERYCPSLVRFSAGTEAASKACAAVDATNKATNQPAKTFQRPYCCTRFAMLILPVITMQLRTFSGIGCVFVVAPAPSTELVSILNQPKGRPR